MVHPKCAQRLREQRLARPGRADQDIGFREFDVVLLGLIVKPLVVIVNGDREHLPGAVLADHMVIEDLADSLRARDDATTRFTSEKVFSSSTMSMHSVAITLSFQASTLPKVNTQDELPRDRSDFNWCRLQSSILEDTDV